MERAFGVLQARWPFVKGSSRLFYLGDIANIIYACIIKHNMIVDDEGEGITDVVNENTPGPSHDVASESHRQGLPYNND